MRNEIMYTHVGLASWPALSTPHPKFGGFKVELLSTPEQAAVIQKKYEEAYEQYYQEECQKQGKKQLKRASASPFIAQKRDDGTETGDILIRFKEKDSYKDKASGQLIKKRIRIVDSQKKDVKEPVWGGSDIKIAYTYRPWYTAALGFGLGLRIVAVQVLKLVTKGDGSAALNGFDIEEDGYVADEEETTEAPVETPSDVKASGNEVASIKGNF